MNRLAKSFRVFTDAGLGRSLASVPSLPARAFSTTSTTADKAKKVESQLTSEGRRMRPRQPKQKWEDAFRNNLSKGTVISEDSSIDSIWRTTPPVDYSPPVEIHSARSVPVVDGNVVRALRRLNRTLKENNLYRETRQKARFELPGDKRHRLSSERHRRRFKAEVAKAIHLANELKHLR